MISGEDDYYFIFDDITDKIFSLSISKLFTRALSYGFIEYLVDNSLFNKVKLKKPKERQGVSSLNTTKRFIV